MVSCVIYIAYLQNLYVRNTGIFLLKKILVFSLVVYKCHTFKLQMHTCLPAYLKLQLQHKMIIQHSLFPCKNKMNINNPQKYENSVSQKAKTIQSNTGASISEGEEEFGVWYVNICSEQFSAWYFYSFATSQIHASSDMFHKVTLLHLLPFIQPEETKKYSMYLKLSQWQIYWSNICLLEPQ